MTRNEEKIKELCSSASADINLCRVAYTVIDNAPEEEKATLLEAFIIGYRNTPTNHSLDLPCFIVNCIAKKFAYYLRQKSLVFLLLIISIMKPHLQKNYPATPLYTWICCGADAIFY